MLPNLLLICILSSLIFTTHSYSSQCLDHQKSLLLQLRNELIFNSSLSTKLVKWNQRDDCCKWYGVECDVAGNIISLQLNDESISGGIGDSSSLFRLMYLRKLNLAHNHIYTRIPRGIHNLTYLTHLNLSNAGFGGQVPAEISSLTRLISLDISEDDFDYYVMFISEPLKLEYPNLEMLVQDLTDLRELYLDGVNITSSNERRKWSHIISSYLPNITSLSLRGCLLCGPLARSFWQLHSLSILQLDGNDLSTVTPTLFANLSSLTTLSLSSCGLNGSFPNVIFQSPTLQNIDLCENLELSGNIPPFSHNGSLKYVRLSRTNFSGLIPSSIRNLKFLSEIDLSYCRFTGSIPSTFANLTQLAYVDLSYNLFTGSLSSTMFDGFSNLVYVDLEANSFSGNIPQSLFGLPSLLELHLGTNQFNGLVEEFSIVNASNIVILDLSHNRLEGPIPDFFFQLQSLETLWLFRNLFNGSFQLDKTRSLANLTYLDLSDNNLLVHVGNDNSSTYGLPWLDVLNLASCNMNGFPDFIEHSEHITWLDLSNNQIGGEIPSWIWGTQLQILDLSFNLLTDLQKPYYIPASLQILDLRSNQLRGELHMLSPPHITSEFLGLTSLLLANNSFSGSIPTSICTAKWLRDVDLSINKLSGSIPPCLTNLRALDLGQNNISGHIPNKFSLDCSLYYFDLNNNTLEGKIPKSLESCKRLELMNVGNNIINDTFPCMLSSSLRVLVLHSNRFHGEVTCQNNWPDLQILDISSNNFRGSLESINFSSWRAMQGSDPKRGTTTQGITLCTVLA